MKLELIRSNESSETEFLKILGQLGEIYEIVV